jgi:hypothetical protein
VHERLARDRAAQIRRRPGEANGSEPRLIASTPERAASPRYVLQSARAAARAQSISSMAAAAGLPGMRLRSVGIRASSRRAPMRRLEKFCERFQLTGVSRRR